MSLVPATAMMISDSPCDFVTSLFTSVDYKTVTFSVFCLIHVFLLMRKTRKYLSFLFLRYFVPIPHYCSLALGMRLALTNLLSARQDTPWFTGTEFDFISPVVDGGIIH